MMEPMKLGMVFTTRSTKMNGEWIITRRQPASAPNIANSTVSPIIQISALRGRRIRSWYTPAT